jgi:hypothetical protein
MPKITVEFTADGLMHVNADCPMPHAVAALALTAAAQMIVEQGEQAEEEKAGRSPEFVADLLTEDQQRELHIMEAQFAGGSK